MIDQSFLTHTRISRTAGRARQLATAATFGGREEIFHKKGPMPRQHQLVIGSDESAGGYTAGHTRAPVRDNARGMERRQRQRGLRASQGVEPSTSARGTGEPTPAYVYVAAKGGPL